MCRSPRLLKCLIISQMLPESDCLGNTCNDTVPSGLLTCLFLSSPIKIRLPWKAGTYTLPLPSSASQTFSGNIRSTLLLGYTASSKKMIPGWQITWRLEKLLINCKYTMGWDTVDLCIWCLLLSGIIRVPCSDSRCSVLTFLQEIKLLMEHEALLPQYSYQCIFIAYSVGFYIDTFFKYILDFDHTYLSP